MNFNGSILIRQNPVTNWEKYALTLDPRPAYGKVGWRKCKASQRAEGGYWRATFDMTGPLDFLADFMLNGLTRDVRFYAPDDAVQVWEGFIYEMTLNTKTAELKTSMDRVANNVWARYRVTGESTTTRSTPQTDTASQNRYGKRDFIFGMGELEGLSIANNKCKQYLNLNKEPKPTRIGEGRPDDEYSMMVDCRGYFDTLNWQVYNATTAGSDAASVEISTIVTAKCQFVASKNIYQNLTSVSRVYDVDRFAGDIIQDIARLGDEENNRWVCGMTNDRTFYFTYAALHEFPEDY